MKTHAERIHIAKKAILAARNAGWSEEEALAYAAETVQRFDPTLNVVFARAFVTQLRVVAGEAAVA